MRRFFGSFLKTGLFLALFFCFTLAIGQGSLSAAEPIKIGTIFSITGWAGFLGSAQKEIFTAMLDDINSKGGIGGRQIELYFEDDKSNPTNAVIAATKLIKDRKVVILVGTSITDSALAIVPLCEQEKVPFINSGPALIPFKKWIFSIGPGAPRSAAHMLEFAVKELGGKRIALLHSSDADGRLGGKAIMDEIGKYPASSIIIEETFEPTDTNMVPQLTKVKSANPDVIVLYTTAAPASVVAKNYKQLGLTYPVVGFAGITAPEFAKNTGKIAEETKWICLTVPILLAEKMAPSDPYRRNVYEPVKKLMQEKYGPTKRVTLFHGSSHDAIKAAVEAMKAAERIDSASIRDALEKIRIEGFVGDFACTSTDHQGAPVDPMRPAVLRDGEWVPYVK
jgi:branched-chain amino acid transport system substrate-binding protein